jgi:predicted ester cyclase
MSTAANKAQSERWFEEVWSQRREATIYAMLGPDIVGHLGTATWSASGTHRGEFSGVAPTGKPVRFGGMTWLRFREGRLVEGWDSWDAGGLVQQLASG